MPHKILPRMLNAESFPSWFDVPSLRNIPRLQQIFPRGFSANFVLLTWSLLGSVLAYGLLANFRIMLLRPVMEKPVDTAQDILDRGMIPVVDKKGYYYVDHLKQSSNPVYQHLADIAVIPNDYAEVLSILEKYLQGANTHVYLCAGINYDMMKLGSYYYSKEVLEGSAPWIVWIVNKKWPLKDALAKHLLRYQQVCKTRNAMKYAGYKHLR